MDLYHVTPKVNREYIRKQGLRLTHSLGKTRKIWFATWLLLPWAWRHVAKHQGNDLDELSCFRFRLTRGLLQRRRSGIWIAHCDIPASTIVGEFTFKHFKHFFL